MMKIAFSPKCLKQIEKIKKTDTKLFDKLQKQILIFEQNPEHPSLRLHKLKGNQQQSWSISVDMSYRLLYYISDQKQKKVVFFSFGSHEEVYK